MEGACACSLLTQPEESAVKCKNINKFPAVPAHSLLLLSTLIHSFRAKLKLCCSSPAVYPSVEPGWLQATYEGRTGLIPENYVVFL